MSMSTSVTGIKAPDEKWKKMKEVFDVCIKNKVQIPAEVYNFFEGEDPDSKGVIIDIQKLDCCTNFSTGYQHGFEIELSKLPKDLTHLRFYNSW